MVQRQRDDLNLKEAFELARAGLQALILVNGGAAAGLLTFYGNLISHSGGHVKSPEGFRWALEWFALGGVGGAVLALLLAYFTQMRWGIEIDDKTNLWSYDVFTRTLHTLASLAAITSAASFGIGVVVVGGSIV